jgi:hypothetical protein
MRTAILSTWQSQGKSRYPAIIAYADQCTRPTRGDTQENDHISVMSAVNLLRSVAMFAHTRSSISRSSHLLASSTIAGSSLPSLAT